ncbi:MAG: PqiC family protein [Gammaproteobacteria bacterium]|nr:PqiC family protein [Gammaproteobacteria bacterium]MBU1645302.1 PqiC family protein [Gammaproteobacteria bacterium]MBU1972295.1 PqiC family protein [Gammaproteobacteria bacterium]
MMRNLSLVLSLALLAGCETPAKTRYYTLSGGAAALSTQAAKSDYRVAIGPVTVPEALDRLQIVLRVAPNRYEISDTDGWSAPLKREIPRVVAEVVAQRLPAAHVAAHLQHGGQGADYQVLIDVVRLESIPNDSTVLEATWSVTSSTGKRLREAPFSTAVTVTAPGVEPLVAAHRQALVSLGSEIARALDSLAQAKRQ